MQKLIMKEVISFILAGLFIFLFLGLILSGRVLAVESEHNHVTLNKIYFQERLSGRAKPVFNLNLEDDWDDDWDDDWKDNRSSFNARYNRVEGLYFGMEIKRDHLALERPNRAFLYGNWGYSFGAKEFTYMGGLEKGFGDDFRTAFGGEYHRLIDTPDRWIIPEIENSLAAFFLKEDFQDFYFREGGSGYFQQNFTRHLSIKVGFYDDKLDSLNKNVNWSLFGGKKKFRTNPAMSVGQLKSYEANLVFDTRNSKNHPRRGWYVQLDGEYARKSIGSDFEFDRFVMDLRRYQSLGYGEGLDLRIRAGSATGEMPWQRTFYLGGISTLRGFGYKAFPNGPMTIGGNRMLLGQIEFRTGSDLIGQAIDLDIFDLNNFVLFADAGWVSSVTDPNLGLFEGFNTEWSDFKSDVGVALTNSRGDVRVEVARRTDTSEKPFTFMFRINRDF